ncbi:MAG: hypothetical protein RR382_07345, partial [Tannerellaceae bacterium]
MDSIRIQNDVLSSAKEEGLAEGEAKGKAEGLAEGEAKGLAKGKEQGLAEGKEQGKAEGLAEGEAKGKRLIALNMKGNGIAADIISACTGLTIEEIEKL